MKYLINQSFKAIRKGEFVSASKEVGEFILDTDDKDAHPVATLGEIAKANKCAIAKREKKDDLISKLTSHLENLEIPEMSEKPQTEVVKEIVADGVAAGKSDDEMLVAIVNAGVPFRAAGKMFMAAMTEGGYRLSNKNRKERCRKILVDCEFTPDDYSEVEAMCERLCNEVEDTVTSQAMSIIRSYAKEFEIGLPKPVKKAAGGLKTRALKWMLENKEATKQDVADWIAQQGKADPKGKTLQGLWEILEFAQSFAAE